MQNQTNQNQTRRQTTQMTKPVQSMTVTYDMTPLIVQVVAAAEKENPGVKFMASIELTEDMKLIVTAAPETGEEPVS